MLVSDKGLLFRRRSVGKFGLCVNHKHSYTRIVLVKSLSRRWGWGVYGM